MTSNAVPDFDALWDYQDPAATEARFRALLPAAERGGDRSYHLQLLTQIARTQGLQRAFDAAHATLDGVEPQLGADPVRARIRYLLERGRVLNSARQPAEAVPLFQAALDLAVRHGEDFYAVDAAHMLAIAAPAEARLAWNLHALSLAEASGDPRARGWQGSLYNNIGWTYHDAGQYAEALAMFEKALAWEQTVGTPRDARIARWSIARALRSLGRLDEALTRQEALQQDRLALGELGSYGEEELGECLLALGRPDEARPHFAQAYVLLRHDPWLAANEPERLARLAALGGAAPPAH